MNCTPILTEEEKKIHKDKKGEISNIVLGEREKTIKQACKPRSYASSKLCPVTHSQGLSVELLA